MSHLSYPVLAIEISRACGEDDPVGVDKTSRVRELEFDVRASRRVVEPARLSVNIDLYRDGSTGETHFWNPTILLVRVCSSSSDMVLIDLEQSGVA